MADKDIRSGDDWQETGSTHRTNQRWLERVPTDDLKPLTKAVRAAIPMQTVGEEGTGGVDIVGPDGRPLTMRSEVARTEDELALAWKRKMEREPCWMCKHFRFRVLTEEQKLRFVMNLVKDHGWTEQMIRGEIGDLSKFEYCPVYELLTHRDASCPDYWVKRSDL
jgi:hypothetical protein